MNIKKFFLPILMILYILTASTSMMHASPLSKNKSKAEYLALINNYLNSFSSFKASFIQVDNNSAIDTGHVYIVKPDKLRIEYDDPRPVLIILNKDRLAYIDHKLEQTSYDTVDDIFISILMRKNVKLNESDVGLIEERGGNIIVESYNNINGIKNKIYIYFQKLPFMIKKIEVEADAMNIMSVNFENVELNAKLDGKIFRVKNYVKKVK